MSKAKHSKNAINSKRKAAIRVMIFILIISLFVSCKSILIKCRDDKEQEEISKVLDTINILKDDINEFETERMLQIKKLKNDNNEIIGWLEIEGTNINYPVCQSNDNNYYLTHTYKRKKNSNGSLFLDKEYDFSINSLNLLIYGHRNKNGLMFDELLKYKSEDFYREHNAIRFTTEYSDDKYEIISIFNSKVYFQDEKDVFRYYYFVNVRNEDEYNEYIKKCKESSIYRINFNYVYGEKLITLSTCDDSQENGRFVVVAKIKKMI